MAGMELPSTILLVRLYYNQSHASKRELQAWALAKPSWLERATGASKPRTLAASRLQGVRIKSIIDRVDINLHLVLLELSSIRRSLEIRGQVLSEQTALLSCWCERQLMTLLMVRGDEANATKSTRKMRNIPGHSLYSFRGTRIRSLRSQLGRI